jgi:molybdenum cofactor biosynthesis enzyme MoaA
LEKILSHLDFFNISLDGASKQTFEKIRRKGDFDQTLENIRQIMGIIKKKHLKLDESWINFVIQAANYHEISDMVKLTARLGLPALNFKLMNTNYDRGTRDLNRSGRTVKNRMETNLFDDKESIDRSIREAVQSGNRYRVKVFFQQDINKDFSFINCGLSQKVFITFDGYITPCCLRTEPGIFNFGNILTDDYGQVFGSEKYLGFIHGLTGGRPPALCTRCPSLETLRK